MEDASSPQKVTARSVNDLDHAPTRAFGPQNDSTRKGVVAQRSLIRGLGDT